MRVPLALLPGMNCSARLWEEAAAHLEDDRPILPLTLDRPSLDDQVDALLERLPGRFAVAGLSLGAIVAMAMHRRAPERVAGLCLVSTNARPPTRAQRAAWQSQLDRLASGASARELQEDLLPALTGSETTPAVRRLTLDMADEVGPGPLTNQLRLQGNRVDERPGLATARVPCAILAAEDDAICPMDRHTEIHRLVRGSELVVVPGAPHLMTLTHPQAVADAMRAWLGRVDG